MKKLAFLALLLSTAAYAADSKIDFTTPLKAPNGKDYTECTKNGDDGKCVEQHSISLGDVVLAALALGDRNETLQKQAQKGRLQFKVYGNNGAALSSDEKSLIINQLAKLGYNPGMVFVACRMIDPVECKD